MGAGYIWAAADSSPDRTTEIAIWSTVELGVGVTAGCVATLRPLVSSLLKKCGVRSGIDTRGTDIPKAITRGNRMSLNQFGTNYGHGTTVTTITGQRKEHSRGSSEEPLTVYPGQIGKTFLVETEETDIGHGHVNDSYYPGR